MGSWVRSLETQLTIGVQEISLVYRDRYTKRQLERMDIARELLANRYMLNVILSTLYKLAISIDDFLEVAKQKEKGLIGKRTKKEERTKEEIKKEKGLTKKKSVLNKTRIEFEKFSLTARQHQALVREYGADVVSEACIMLDGYLRNRLTRPKDCYKKLKDWAIHLVMKERLRDIRRDINNINREIDYKAIEDKTTALRYIASVPSHVRNINPAVKYLVEKFNIDMEVDNGNKTETV